MIPRNIYEETRALSSIRDPLDSICGARRPRHVLRSDNIEVVLPSVHIGDVQIDNSFLTCKTLHLWPDPMEG